MQLSISCMKKLQPQPFILKNSYNFKYFSLNILIKYVLIEKRKVGTVSIEFGHILGKTEKENLLLYSLVINEISCCIVSCCMTWSVGGCMGYCMTWISCCIVGCCMIWSVGGCMGCCMTCISCCMIWSVGGCMGCCISCCVLCCCISCCIVGCMNNCSSDGCLGGCMGVSLVGVRMFLRHLQRQFLIQICNYITLNTIKINNRL